MIATGNIASNDRYFSVNNFDGLDQIAKTLQQTIQSYVLEGELVKKFKVLTIYIYLYL